MPPSPSPVTLLERLMRAIVLSVVVSASCFLTTYVGRLWAFRGHAVSLIAFTALWCSILSFASVVAVLGVLAANYPLRSERSTAFEIRVSEVLVAGAIALVAHAAALKECMQFALLLGGL